MSFHIFPPVIILRYISQLLDTIMYCEPTVIKNFFRFLVFFFFANIAYEGRSARQNPVDRGGLFKFRAASATIIAVFLRVFFFRFQTDIRIIFVSDLTQCFRKRLVVRVFARVYVFPLYHNIDGQNQMIIRVFKLKFFLFFLTVRFK